MRARAEKFFEHPPQNRQQVARVTNAAPPARESKATPTLGMIQVIADAVRDPKVETDKMRVLFEMQKEIANEEARREFTRAYIAMQADLPVINAKGRIVIPPKEGSRNRTTQVTPYATFNEIHRITKPILAAHGFTIQYLPDALPDGRLVMGARLDHVGGAWRDGRIVLPMETSGSKNNVQGVGSSIAYGKRYLAVTMLNLASEASEDADDDGAAAGQLETKGKQTTIEVPAHITASQAKALHAAIDMCGVGLDRFLVKYGIDKVEHLPAPSYSDALAACRDFAEKKGSNGG